MAALLALTLGVAAAPPPPPHLAQAGSAAAVLDRWSMRGSDGASIGSWVGHGPGGGRHDACSPNAANQSCKCNGYQGNWVRANAVEALCNYQIASGARDYDVAIEHSWPAEGFELNSAAPYACDPTAAEAAMPNGDAGWPYYDDILWWALASLRAADMYTQRGETARAANATARSASIFDNVAARAWSDSKADCGGGIWWSTARSYKNAIANELFLATAAKLANREWAEKIWKWFKHSGMINNKTLINDGLSHACANNGAREYSYNQGVILGGLSQLYTLTNDPALLQQAVGIVDAVLLHLTDSSGVLAGGEGGAQELCGDGSLFKGIFVRYLRYLIDAHEAKLDTAKVGAWREFLSANANSLWASQDVEGKFPIYWGAGAPLVFPSGSVGLQTAAIDAFVSAAAPGEAPPPAVTAAAAKEGDAQKEKVATAVQCHGAGTRVHDRCVCNSRYTGADCQLQIDWLAYYGSGGRKVLIMTDSGRFLSSSGGNRPNLAVSHTSAAEYFSIVPCGAGVGLVDSAGKWLALKPQPPPPAGQPVPVLAEVTLVNASEVNCKSTAEPAAWIVNATSPSGPADEAASFTSTVPVGSTRANSSWFFTVDRNDATGDEALIAVAATDDQAAHGYEHAALWFRVRLQQSCQNV